MIIFSLCTNVGDELQVIYFIISVVAAPPKSDHFDQFERVQY